MKSHLTAHRVVVAAILTVILAASGPDVHAFLRPAPAPAPVDEEPAPRPADAGPPSQEVDQFDSYDRDNPDYARLQKAPDALRGLPLDQNGIVDWARALREGAINPREVLDGKKNYLPLDLDVIMRNTKAMPYVRFPHKTHTEWLACSNCHPSIFEEKAGTAKIKMEDIFRGQFCGKCHDRVAFITHRACFRCHSVPQASVPLP